VPDHETAATTPATQDTITISNGTYLDSNILVNSPVVIQGESQAEVVFAPDVPDVNEDSSFGGNFRHALIVQSSDVTIKTLTIDGNLTPAPVVYGYRDGIITDFRLGSPADQFNNLTF
jgi:hypothetical protein